MAALPPPPIRAQAGDYAWLDWYNNLQKALTVTGAIQWTQVDKTGSSIADLQNKAHDLTTGLQGGTTGEHYHLTAAEHTAIATVFTPAYGSFSDSTNQAVGAANTPQTITFNTTGAVSGVSVGSPTSRLVCAAAGKYNFNFSLQIESSTASSRLVTIWPRVNGTDIANSATTLTIKSSTDVIVPSWDFTLSMNANDYFELVWAADGTSVSLSAHASQTSPFTRPAVPSAKISVTRVG